MYYQTFKHILIMTETEISRPPEQFKRLNVLYELLLETEEGFIYKTTHQEGDVYYEVFKKMTCNKV